MSCTGANCIEETLAGVVWRQGQANTCTLWDHSVDSKWSMPSPTCVGHLCLHTQKYSIHAHVTFPVAGSTLDYMLTAGHNWFGAILIKIGAERGDAELIFSMILIDFCLSFRQIPNQGWNNAVFGHRKKVDLVVTKLAMEMQMIASGPGSRNCNHISEH